MLVITGEGKIARVLAVPRSQDVASLVNPGAGGAVVDPLGRLVYRLMPDVGAAIRAAQSKGGEGEIEVTPPPDSVAIIRVNLTTRSVDTATFIKVAVPQIRISRQPDGFFSFSETVNPLPVSDDWTVLADGTIAVVRGRDYHVDWFDASGGRTSSAKIPFTWERLSDSQKVVFIDSVKAVRARLIEAERQAQPTAPAARASAGMGAPPTRGGMPARPPLEPPPARFVTPGELPDYKPPFLAGSTRADPDGNLWIRIQGGDVYDVVSRGGRLVDRVRVPNGRVVLGFGSDGTVYLGSRSNAPGGAKLERVRVR
jgi:hypothetical protein